MTKTYWEVSLTLYHNDYNPLIREVEVIRETEKSVWLKEQQGLSPEFRNKRGSYYQYYTEKQDAVDAYVRYATRRKNKSHIEIRQHKHTINDCDNALSFIKREYGKS